MARVDGWRIGILCGWRRLVPEAKVTIIRNKSEVVVIVLIGRDEGETSSHIYKDRYSFIHVRITPFMSMYLLDFVDNFGKRIEGRTDLDVFDGGEGENIYNLIKPLGKRYSSDCELETYMLHSARAYERPSDSLPPLLPQYETTKECFGHNAYHY